MLARQINFKPASGSARTKANQQSTVRQKRSDIGQGAKDWHDEVSAGAVRAFEGTQIGLVLDGIAQCAELGIITLLLPRPLSEARPGPERQQQY